MSNRFNYAFLDESRKNKKPYVPQPLKEITLPPLDNRKEEEEVIDLELKLSKTRRKNEIYSFCVEDIYNYDIKDMKPTSIREVRLNPSLLRSNKPSNKRTKVTIEDVVENTDTNERVSIEEWIETGKFSLVHDDSKLGAKSFSKTSTTSRKQSARDDSTSSGETPLGDISSRLPYLKEVFLKDTAPSKELLQYSSLHSTEKTIQTKKLKRIAPDDEEEISKLKTGDDAVAFFSKAGKNTAVKFVYLNRSDTNGVDYRPYDLVIVAKSETNPEYFTMSSTGVVHICPGQPTEYMSLSEWMKESTMFNVLRRIRFFKYYLVHKCFRLWYQNTKYLKYSKKRVEVARSYFLAKRTFASSLMKIHKFSHDIQYTSIMELREKENSEPSVTIEQFHTIQKDLRSKSSKTFDEIIEKMEEILVQLCDDVTSRSRVPDMNASENIEAYLSGKLPNMEAEGDYTNKKSKSMVEAQEEEEKRQRALKKAKEEADMLGNFIRVSDYMAVEALVTLSKKILDKFKVTLQETKSILFLVSLLFKNDGSGDIVFEPSENAILHMLQSNSEEIVTTVSQVPRLLYMRKFKIYFENLDKYKMDEHLRQLHVGKVLHRDEVFNLTKNQIENMLRSDFAKALEYGKEFEGLKYWFKFGKNWDDKYAEKRHTVQEFTEKIKQVNEALLELKRMNFVQEKGILFIDSKQLRNTLQPIMENIYEQIKSSISITSREMCLELNKKFLERVRIMKEEPTKLKDFAKFIDNHNKIRKETRQLMMAADEVEKMNELAAKNRVEMDRADQVALESLKEIKEEFLSVFKKAELYKENNMSAKKAELEENVQKVSDDLLDVMTVLRSPPFISSDSDPADVLERLSKIGEEISQMREKTEIYKEYQILLEAPVKEWTNLVGAENQFNIRSQIWNTLDEFMKRAESWDTTDIQKLDVKEMEQEVEKYLQMASDLAKYGEDEVIRLLRKIIQGWKDNMSIILLIGNKDLKPYHWEQIFKGMNKDLAKGTSYTLRQLNTLGVFLHRDLVTEISNNATLEAELIRNLEKVFTYWREKEFDIKSTQASRKEMLILYGTEDIQEKLMEHQTTLKSMIESPHSSTVKIRIEELQNKLVSVAKILLDWLSCQRKLMSLEFLLNSDDSSPQHDEISKYLSVSSEYKELMSRTSLNRNVILATNEEGVYESLQSWNIALEEIETNIKKRKELANQTKEEENIEQPKEQSSLPTDSLTDNTIATL